MLKLNQENYNQNFRLVIFVSLNAQYKCWKYFILKSKDTVNDLKAADSVRRIQAQVPWTSLANITDPVFVSAVASGGVDMAVSFLKNIYTYR